MTPSLRKLALTAHLTTSVGWLGAIAAFLALAIVGLVGRDPATASACYVAMALVYGFAVVPLGLASFLSGLVSSLATERGLVRHYWVLVKLVMTIPLTLLLLVHMGPVGLAARLAAAGGDPGGLKTQLAAYAAAALVALVAATLLSTYKPRGRTPYGRRQP